MRDIPFEYQSDFLASLYGKPGQGETEAVGNVQVEKSVMDQIREARDRAAAKRESRTDAEPEK